MTVAVIPVRSFRAGMQRLNKVLSEQERWRLGQALAERVTRAAIEAGLTALVVTAETEVDAWAVANGFRVVADPGVGLNAAAAIGAASVGEKRWLLIHSDLPLLRAEDLRPLTDAIEDGHNVIAPSSDGGTSALSSSGPIVFGYGPGSFHIHLARLEDPVAITSPGLLHDLDTVEDLESVLVHRHGRWLKGIY